MKLAIISDTHGEHERVEVPEADVLLHCGDFTARDTTKEIAGFAGWMARQPHRYKAVICGNHDKQFYGTQDYYLKMFGSVGIHYLQDSSLSVDGLLIYGSPWTPKFFNWHWMLHRNSDALESKWDAIPQDTNVLITHGPAHGTLDFADERCGCELLTDRIGNLRDLKLHCFGHIHAGYGVVDNTAYDEQSVIAVNAAIMDESYKPVNKPIVIEL